MREKINNIDAVDLLAVLIVYIKIIYRVIYISHTHHVNFLGKPSHRQCFCDDKIADHADGLGIEIIHSIRVKAEFQFMLLHVIPG